MRSALTDNLLRVIQLFERCYARHWREPLNVDTVRALLHQERPDQPLSVVEVETIFDLLCHPILNAARYDARGRLALTMTGCTLARTVDALAKALARLDQSPE